MNESVYIDTSVVSYLTARPAQNLVTAARQVETIECKPLTLISSAPR